MNLAAFAKCPGAILLLLTLHASGVCATIRGVLGAVTAEHTRALRAATKAAAPRETLAELRALYVPSEPHPHRTEAGGSGARKTSEVK